MTNTTTDNQARGEFIDLDGERYYVIHDIDRMKPFFISVVSNSNHWMFVSSYGGLTAGRVSPKTALFPYVTVDKIHESTHHTGSKTLVRVELNGESHGWEPFNREHDGRFELSRNLYKNALGNRLRFEEINHSLGLTYRYTWSTSDTFGFVRDSELINHNDHPVELSFVDGLQNLLPAGTPAFAQTNTSNLVDAYKWTELDPDTGLAYLTLYSGITDRAEPSESLKATTVFCLGLESPNTLISRQPLDAFRQGKSLTTQTRTRGVRGAYFVHKALTLGANSRQSWRIVADLEQRQSAVVGLRQELSNPTAIDAAVSDSIERGSKDLRRIMANCDGFQTTNDERVSVHHYANVLFNVMRGGFFFDQYTIPGSDFANNVRHFNQGVYENHRGWLESLPSALALNELLDEARERNDPQLMRLAFEYLPITFGRRHGDPSRPWNQFTIDVQDEHGNNVLSYEGNWRDIFQNWEALLLSFPEFTEGVIAKFVNASTIDGYNPYRITKQGIDWEVEEPDDPWSYIGYWGDHQIIYLQKLLELSHRFHPDKLGKLLHERVYSYANVPYRIAAFDQLLVNPKSTVAYDETLASLIDTRVEKLGADGKLILDSNGQVYHVNLLEKLLVPLLAKLGNLVVDGGIWLTTQRPEWNDANNALVGHGLSMVTLYYMRRYVTFVAQLISSSDDNSVELSAEVHQWLQDTRSALAELAPTLGEAAVSADARYQSLTQLGQAASRYRTRVYAQEGFSGVTTCDFPDLTDMLDLALSAIDHSIATNRRDDHLYHAYNLIGLGQNSVTIDTLYPMLEGQVAALSAGNLPAAEVLKVLKALFASDIYRANQDSFMLYPDRDLPGFLEKNRIPAKELASIDLVQQMLSKEDYRLVEQDPAGDFRFNADFANVNDVKAMLTELEKSYGNAAGDSHSAICALYESVFNHKAFTGRSGTMFGFEGLGSIYWHMVSKLLLAVMENFFQAVDQHEDASVIAELGEYYYRISKGIGFNKTPSEYGAFPTDPYSHTPENSGARQPGMTGQVKEEVICRLAELGVRVRGGTAVFQPALLRQREFVDSPATLNFVNVAGESVSVEVPARGLAFTWCQIPLIYTLCEPADEHLEVTFANGSSQRLAASSGNVLSLTPSLSRHVFERTDHIRQIRVAISSARLLSH